MRTLSWFLTHFKSLILISLLYLITPIFTTLSDGLPRVEKSPLSRLIDQPTITSIYQDRSQVLWIGTQHGLYRFNGAERRVFSSNLGGADYIPVSDIRGITEDAEGQILIGTFGAGLLRWDPLSSSFIAVSSSSTSKDAFVRLLYASNNIIWISTSSGLSRVLADTEEKDDWLHQRKKSRKYL